ncbi:mechanosensitive ion channel family protein [Aliiroseovarius sediminis]|uniref:mechanosensitive ion channel family protein n=1 Tax=Aliiroseovarius sediminis TaxID=2925839 RepID=UPI001F5AFBDB|nr:mechanosensitive ion channel family protein [Aliiroseovarius sediminis]MCI2394042.1 mechanosensitive ion channel family protein [Aliiroseovarius sediminis]
MTMDEVVSYLNAQWSGFVGGAAEVLPELAAALIVILLTWGLSRLAKMGISRLGQRMRLRSNLIEVLVMLASVGFWLVGALIAVTLVFPSITPAKALTTLGLGSVAIGFAFKDTFENFLAGILILLREPFALGDFVECEDIEGQVEKITIRDTHIRQTDGQLVVVPNHMLFQNPVTVRTSRDLRRITVICGVAYGEDVDKAREVISDAVRNVHTVRDDVKDVQIFAKSFGASSIDFEVTWWTGSKPIDVRQSRDQVIAAVKRALDEKGIEIPFPYRTLTFAEPIPVTQVSE